MVKRGIIVIIISILLLTMGVIELLATNNITTELRHEIATITEALKENESDITTLEPKVLELKEKWTEKEFYLCLMFNRTNFTVITEHLNVLHSYVELNEYTDAYVQLQLLDLIIKESKDYLKFSFENVI